MAALASFWQKNKMVIIIVSVAIIVIALGAWWFYSKGKDSASVEQAALPTDSAGGKLSTDEAKTVRAMTKKLYDQMNTSVTEFFELGALAFNADDAVFADYVAMNNKLFVAVYNDYNTLYYKEVGQTLKEEIDGTITIDSDLRNSIITKMVDNNLA